MTGQPPKSPQTGRNDFAKRRNEARAKIDAMDRDILHDSPERRQFFNSVYQQAGGDAAFVPWADLKGKDKLNEWLKEKSGIGLSAIDVACGLGDNAQAIAAAGYNTTAFDLSEDAIKWAKKRFENSTPQAHVNYVVADLFDLPGPWKNGFDLVHECYTFQALAPPMVEQSAAAIASLVKPGGSLLVYTRCRADGSPVDGPPWPLQEKQLSLFAEYGFRLVKDERFEINRNDRQIPHAFMEWQRPV